MCKRVSSFHKVASAREKRALTLLPRVQAEARECEVAADKLVAVRVLPDFLEGFFMYLCYHLCCTLSFLRLVVFFMYVFMWLEGHRGSTTLSSMSQSIIIYFLLLCNVPCTLYSHRICCGSAEWMYCRCLQGRDRFLFHLKSNVQRGINSINSKRYETTPNMQSSPTV